MCSETITIDSLMSDRFGFVNMSEESSISLTLALTCIISNCGPLCGYSLCGLLLSKLCNGVQVLPYSLHDQNM